MEIKCLKMRPELSLLRSFRKGERDLGSASAHRASGPAAWEVQLSSRLFSLFAVSRRGKQLRAFWWGKTHKQTTIQNVEREPER